MAQANLARADIIGPLPLIEGSVNGEELPWTTNLIFPTFDPSQGTLQSVELILSWSYAAGGSVYNYSNLEGPPGQTQGSPSVATVAANVQFAIDDPDFILPTPEINTTSSSQMIGLDPSDTQNWNTSGGGVYDQTFTDPTLLSEFGTNTSINLLANAEVTPSITYTGGDTVGQGGGAASLSGTVTYTVVVPEPASFAILLAAAPILISRRRKLTPSA